jgi:hypothetical protein
MARNIRELKSHRYIVTIEVGIVHATDVLTVLKI